MNYICEFNFRLLIPFLYRENHVSPNAVIYNANVCDELNDEVLLF